MSDEEELGFEETKLENPRELCRRVMKECIDDAKEICKDESTINLWSNIVPALFEARIHFGG